MKNKCLLNYVRICSLAACAILPTVSFAQFSSFGELASSSTPAPVKSKPISPEGPKYSKIGLLVDAGFPGGLGASIVVRPVYVLRLQAGAQFNGISGGFKLGATLVPLPFYSPVAPSITIEGGYLFSGNATSSKLISSQVPADFAPLVSGINYGFINVHGGIEFNSKKHFTFFIHGGFSYLDLKMSSVGSTANPLLTYSSQGVTTNISNPSFKGLTPSASIGIIIYF